MSAQTTPPPTTSTGQASPGSAAPPKPAQWGSSGPALEDGRPKTKTALIMASLALATFLAALDMTIVATALPTISAHFQLSESDYSWVGSAYLLAAAASATVWGKVSDIFGRKPIVILANALFFIGSLIAGISQNSDTLIAGRAIQGIGGGGLLILVNVCISDLFSMRSRGKYFGIIGMVWAVASALGPIIGGALTQRASWRWCFLVNLPTIGASLVVIFFLLDIHNPKTPLLLGLKTIDWLGTVFVIGGTTMFLLGLQFGGVTFPWSSATVICLIVFGLLAVGIFVLVEAKFAHNPVIPLSIFNKRSNVASLGVSFCHGFVFISGSYFLPLYFQTVLGKSPILSGVYLFPFILSLSSMSAFTGIWIKRTGRYLELIWIGIFLQALGFGLFIDFPPHASWPRLIIFQIIAGLGVGMNFQSPLIALQTLVEPRNIATATATFQFVRQLSMAVSVTLGSVIFQNRMGSKRALLVSTLGPQLGNLLADGSAGANTGSVGSLSPSQRAVVNSVYTSSLKDMWIMYVCVGAVGVAVSLLITRQTLSTRHVATKTGLEAQTNGAEGKTVAHEEGGEKVNDRNAPSAEPLTPDEGTPIVERTVEGSSV